MAETRIVEKGPLLTSEGRLKQTGYATQLLLRYDRGAIAAPPWRIKEWDYYLINDNHYAVALTVADLGYMGLISASVINLVRGSSHTASVMTPVPFGRMGMPASSDKGVTEFENDRVLFRFSVKDGVRNIHAHFKRFDKKSDLVVDARLDDEPKDTMVIATPWKENPKAFYYNQKIIGMRASGSFKMGRVVHGFSPDDSFGLLDWGRGVWTYDNTWYWGCAQGWQDGKGNATVGSHVVGFNIGYGFGDTSAAGENMFFVDGVMHKIGPLDFGIPKKTNEASSSKVGDIYDLTSKWHVCDEEGRLDLTFTPLHDRIDYMNYGVVISDQHQVFGTFSGKVVLDDGTDFLIEGLRGSAEVIRNKY